MTTPDVPTWLRERADAIDANLAASRGRDSGRQRDRHRARAEELRAAARDLEALLRGSTP